MYQDIVLIYLLYLIFHFLPTVASPTIFGALFSTTSVLEFPILSNIVVIICPFQLGTKKPPILILLNTERYVISVIFFVKKTHYF